MKVRIFSLQFLVSHLVYTNVGCSPICWIPLKSWKGSLLLPLDSILLLHFLLCSKSLWTFFLLLLFLHLLLCYLNIIFYPLLAFSLFLLALVYFSWPLTLVTLVLIFFNLLIFLVFYLLKVKGIIHTSHICPIFQGLL